MKKYVIHYDMMEWKLNQKTISNKIFIHGNGLKQKDECWFNFLGARVRGQEKISMLKQVRPLILKD